MGVWNSSYRKFLRHLIRWLCELRQRLLHIVKLSRQLWLSYGRWEGRHCLITWKMGREASEEVGTIVAGARNPSLMRVAEGHAWYHSHDVRVIVAARWLDVDFGSIL